VVKIMKNYVCEVCGYVYDPKVGDVENGIEAGTSFDNLPEDWICPPCAMGKDVFVEEN
jgi:rubredoxin